MIGPCILMDFDNQIGQSPQTPPPSCRDRGWMGGWVGALCLSFSPSDSSVSVYRGTNGSHSHEGQAQGPHPSTHPPPVPTELETYPLPDLIVHIHQYERRRFLYYPTYAPSTPSSMACNKRALTRVFCQSRSAGPGKPSSSTRR